MGNTFFIVNENQVIEQHVLRTNCYNTIFLLAYIFLISFAFCECWISMKKQAVPNIL